MYVFPCLVRSNMGISSRINYNQNNGHYTCTQRLMGIIYAINFRKGAGRLCIHYFSKVYLLLLLLHAGTERPWKSKYDMRNNYVQNDYVPSSSATSSRMPGFFDDINRCLLSAYIGSGHNRLSHVGHFLRF